MTVVETRSLVAGEVREQAWKVYRQSFEELRYLAVQRHVMYGEEFDDMMADQRVDKFLVWGDDGSLRALATMTNQLPAMPLVSPEYFERRWPEAYRAGHVFCVGFVGVHPESHGSGAFAEVVRAMTEQVAMVDGIVVLDVCAFNREQLQLPRAIHRLVSTWAPRVQMTELDTQTFVGYDFTRGR